ncbi:hypothetical protein [Streptomyces sp. NBC_01006]|uniref:hypothetical protein n=1 Tax=Streptomyces sp. NBC_01006 TaxID=2903716 RepID=UPI0038662233|nr:hypothetical protein OG509_14860 [Streptomyces sp. NBC_01006]
MRPLMVSTVRLAALAVFVTLVAGCTTSEPEPKASLSAKPPEVDLTEACPGLITDAAGKALTDVLQSSHLVNDDAQTVGVTVMGKALEDFYRAGPKAGEVAAPACTVTGTVGRGKRVGEISLAANSGNAGAQGSDQTGVRVTRADRERGVAFDCASTRVGSTRDMPLRIKAVYKDRYQSSRGDAVLGEDYLVLAHSAAVAIAKELGCENNGGLPEGSSALPKP